MKDAEIIKKDLSNIIKRMEVYYSPKEQDRLKPIFSSIIAIEKTLEEIEESKRNEIERNEIERNEIEQKQKRPVEYVILIKELHDKIEFRNCSIKFRGDDCTKYLDSFSATPSELKTILTNILNSLDDDYDEWFAEDVSC